MNSIGLFLNLSHSVCYCLSLYTHVILSDQQDDVFLTVAGCVYIVLIKLQSGLYSFEGIKKLLSTPASRFNFF